MRQTLFDQGGLARRGLGGIFRLSRVSRPQMQAILIESTRASRENPVGT
jgi:hypothetical protein